MNIVGVAAVAKKVLLAEFQSPAVHRAVVALEGAVLATAIAVVRAQLGL